MAAVRCGSARSDRSVTPTGLIFFWIFIILGALLRPKKSPHLLKEAPHGAARGVAAPSSRTGTLSLPWLPSSG